jgi:Ti-type conjugative transfer relaxase TraA
MKPIARSGGRSAVASAAYRAAEKLTNERDGLTHDFRAKQGVEHVEIVLPEGVDAAWARDRSALWNAAEKAENRKDARVAREFEVALPHELQASQRIALTRAFAQELANRYGAAVDFAVHSPHGASDVRNHHAHIMMTTREVTLGGLGDKTLIERENKWLLSNDLPTSQMQLRDIRHLFEQTANQHLAMAGLDIRIDHRSHTDRGLEIEPTEHAGVHATQMQRRGMDISRARLDEDAARRNADLIRDKPDQVLTLITNEKSVFDRHDVARALHRYINDDVQAFQNAFTAVMASPALVELAPEKRDGQDGIELARYSTKEMVELEHAMAKSADRMRTATSHGANRHHVDMAITLQDNTIKASAAAGLADQILRGDLSAADRDRQVSQARLSHEQRAAIVHITGPERIAAVVGFAGAGKSTMLAAARQAWEAQGYQVHGAALSGKAAEGLEQSSGIESRTLASWEYGWQAGRGELCRNDVFVIDEAGMVGSRQLSRFVGAVEKAGGKIVLVGDHEQLQAIGAGAPFRAITERIGYAELSDIRRQKVDWQRDASVAFATHKTIEGLATYQRNGDILISDNRENAQAAIVNDYIADREQRPDGTRIAMAHRRADVRALNAGIRRALQDSGALARGDSVGTGGDDGRTEEPGRLGRELTYQTNEGKRSFAAGDRIVFLENNRDLGVRNGMLGTVQTVEPDAIQVRPDGGALSGQEHNRTVSIPVKSYQAFDHGYATTIHKTQGATVDKSFVLASETMDRHLTYVAMTRHRDSVRLYVDGHEFADRKAGRLIEHGKAPYGQDPQNRDSYFVTLETDGGKKHTTWGVDLERALAASGAKAGDRIGLEHNGSQTVRLPGGQTAERNSWLVRTGDELAVQRLGQRLGRDGTKETTLDYTSDFAARRGIAARVAVASEIALGRNVNQGQDYRLAAGDPAGDNQGQVWAEHGGVGARIGSDRAVAEDSRDGQRSPLEKPAPLVPAVRDYALSIEDVARAKAMPTFDSQWQSVQSVAKLVFTNPGEVTDRLRIAIIEQNGDGRALGKALVERPQQFGDLRGKTGLFGDNKGRKEAHRFAGSVAGHVEASAGTWHRRLEEERSAETWVREKRDTVEVPGLTRQSAELLSQIDPVAVTQRDRWIDRLRSTPDGMQALDEAKVVNDALRQRFGHSDPRNFAPELSRNVELRKQADKITDIARIVERTRMAELSRDHTFKQELSRSKGLGLSR